MATLAGKRALVTGANTGIGREVALELARQGADVIVHWWGNQAEGEQAAADIRALGRKSDVCEADLRDVDSCFRLIDFAAARLGGLDILVNNAGVTDTKVFREFTPQDFDNVFNLNIRGQFFCAQRALEYLSASSSIINMSSLHALASLPGYSVYAATKGAIVSWTRSLAVELAPKGIRVNAVAPGWIDVPSDHLKFPDIDLDAGGRQIPRRRVGDPLDVAKACAYLASDDANYVTGTVMVVDGGLHAQLSLVTPEAHYDD